MIGIVVVSHSRPLAEAAVALAEQMLPDGLGPQVAVAAGLEGGLLGTDAAAISLAIQRVDSDDGVLVLVDMGSAILSTEMALEFLDPDLSDRVVLSSAPLVEGLVSAVLSAATGEALEAVAAEARSALAAKRAQLDDPDGETTDDAGPAPLAVGLPRRAPQQTRTSPITWRTPVTIDHGLHIRPSAAVVTALRDVDADVQLSNATAGRGPVSANGLSRLASLEVRKGDILEARISGPEAERARVILADLAARNFGDNGGRVRPERSTGRALPIAPDHLPGDGRTTASGQQIVIGPIHRRTAIPGLDGYHPRSPKEELARYTRAVELVADYLDALAQARPLSGGILSAQIALVEDREANHEVVSRITEGFSAVDAVVDVHTRSARGYDALTDPYLRERGQDFRSVRRLLLLALMGRPLAEDDPDEPCVWLLDELDAATASRLDRRICLGVITTGGGQSGHGVLTAEARGIPVLTGRPEAHALGEGRRVAFDPTTRELWIDPSEELEADLTARNADRIEVQQLAVAAAHTPAVTRDGVRILVEANVSALADAHAGARMGAEGSGIVRTEILFAARPEAPSAEEQAEVYLAISRALNGGPISIRTWDAGGDKPLAFLPIEPEANPALGERGIRTMFRARDLFREQLRGIILAARQTPVRVMFPMITNPDEVRWARTALDEVLAEFEPVSLPVGIMVEVPAAAIRARDYAGLVDFVSIGTNDLAQYALAADRTNPAVANPLSHDIEAIWDLIAMTRRGLPDTPVAICGDLASEPGVVERALGLGIQELSVRPPMVAQVKHAVRCV